VSARFDCTQEVQRSRGIARAAEMLAEGDLVVLPTDTVYGLGADAFSPTAVAALLAAKGRGREMPPPVLIGHLRTLDGIATGISAQVRALAEAFWPGALTIICQAQPTLKWDLGDTGGTVAVRMPQHPVALELLGVTGPLAVSSANLTGRPPALSCQDAQQQLAESVAVYLDAGPTGSGVPSTIIDGTRDVPRVLRLGALSVAELRTVVPELDPDPDREPDVEPEHAGPAEQKPEPAEPEPAE
jgi:tRNA threonylcarbamoyl adenosine modification protein (Sua5/YciO/YrdC/YwlC family)